MGSVWDPGHMVLVCIREHMLVGTFFTLEAFMLFLWTLWVAVKTAFSRSQAGRETGLFVAVNTTAVSGETGTNSGRGFYGDPAAAGEAVLFSAVLGRLLLIGLQRDLGSRPPGRRLSAAAIWARARAAALSTLGLLSLLRWGLLRPITNCYHTYSNFNVYLICKTSNTSDHLPGEIGGSNGLPNTHVSLVNHCTMS